MILGWFRGLGTLNMVSGEDMAAAAFVAAKPCPPWCVVCRTQAELIREELERWEDLEEEALIREALALFGSREET